MSPPVNNVPPLAHAAMHVQRTLVCKVENVLVSAQLKYVHDTDCQCSATSIALYRNLTTLFSHYACVALECAGIHNKFRDLLLQVGFSIRSSGTSFGLTVSQLQKQTNLIQLAK